MRLILVLLLGIEHYIENDPDCMIVQDLVALSRAVPIFIQLYVSYVVSVGT